MKRNKSKPATAKNLPEIGVPVVVLTADTLIGLVNRMNELEKKVAELGAEVQSNFDHLVEYIPTVTDDGTAMRLKAFARNNGDGCETTVVQVVSSVPDAK